MHFEKCFHLLKIVSFHVSLCNERFNDRIAPLCKFVVVGIQVNDLILKLTNTEDR